ncbi:CBS domain-containing protein [Halovivax sp.]|uniref:CBS domain-containing protein n=1 Tax=Halovivax sp. TaxID=1935978 RepID=UPI0025BFED88|nr:CBS domain-containing protein [Halovivax sp.]
MPVTDIARERVVTVDRTASLGTVARRMREDRVGCVVICDDAKPIGVLGERDLATIVLEESIDPDATTAEELLSGPSVTVDADEGIYSLLRTMGEHGVRRVPIVDDGALVGIVSLSDVVVLLGMELQQVANVIRADAPAYERSPADAYE